MELLPLKTAILHPGDNLAATLARISALAPDDIVVISSKAIATIENAFIDLTSITVSKRAQEEAMNTGRDAAFCQAVLDETERMNGRVVGRCPGALLCLVRPAEGIHIVAANAGLDQSNVPEGMALGWPHDPVASARHLRHALGGCAVIITDSCCTALRTGITAYALACAGIDPVRDERGTPDLFGKKLRITRDNVVDELAAAANFLMGNAAQATPAVIVRGHGLPSSEFAGWIPTFPPEEDLFKDVLKL